MALAPKMKKKETLSMAMRREHLGYPPHPNRLSAVTTATQGNLDSLFPLVFATGRARCHHARRPGSATTAGPNMKGRQSPQTENTDTGEDACRRRGCGCSSVAGRRCAWGVWEKHHAVCRRPLQTRCRPACAPDVPLFTLALWKTSISVRGARRQARRPVVKDQTPPTPVLLIYHARYTSV